MNSYLSWPVTIRGVRTHGEKIPYHITCKFFGDSPYNLQQVIGRLRTLDTSPPERFQVVPTTFETKTGVAYVLLLREYPANLIVCHNAFSDIRRDDHPDYKPHISVSKELWEEVKFKKLSAQDLGIRVGSIQLMKGKDVLFDSSSYVEARSFGKLSKFLRDKKYYNAWKNQQSRQGRDWHDIAGLDDSDVSPDELESALEQTYREEVETFASEFEDRADIKNGKLQIYRCIALKDAEKLDLEKPLGIYWTWDQKRIGCWGGDTNMSNWYVLVARVPLSEVELGELLLLNLGVMGAIEAEVNLNRGAQIELLEVRKYPNKVVKRFDKPIKTVAASDDGYDWENIYDAELYHGSTGPVTKFDVHQGKGQFGDGLYLAIDSKWAIFHSQGGRQGKSGQKLGKTGHLYKIHIRSQNAIRVFDDDAFYRSMISEFDPAGEAFHRVGSVDSIKVTQNVAEYAISLGADVVIFSPKESGVLTPFDQVLVLDDSVIKGTEEVEPNAVESDLKEAIQDVKDHSDKYVGYIKLTPSVEEELREELEDLEGKEIYRCVAFDNEQEFLDGLSHRGTGIYWSYNKDRAVCYWGKDHDYYAILTGVATEDAVDWLSTVEQGLKPQYAGEQEVRLLSNKKIQIKDAEIFHKGSKDSKTIKINKSIPTGEDDNNTPATSESSTQGLSDMVDALLAAYIPDQDKRPAIKVVSDVDYLAKTTFDVEGNPSTTIFVNRKVLPNFYLTRQALAHEIIHHHLYCKYGADVDKHGKEFLEIASKINKVEGDGYVASVADDTDFGKLEEEAKEAVASIDVDVIKRIAIGYLDTFFGSENLPVPDIQIVEDPNNKWLGKTKVPTNGNKSAILINSKICDDLQTVERVVAHELIHHWQYTKQREALLSMVNTSGKVNKQLIEALVHGPAFQEWANRINAVKGTGFITARSNFSYKCS